MLQSMLVQWHPNGPKFQGNNGELSETTESFKGKKVVIQLPITYCGGMKLDANMYNMVICVGFPLYISAMIGLVSYNDPPCFLLARKYINL